MPLRDGVALTEGVADLEHGGDGEFRIAVGHGDAVCFEGPREHCPAAVPTHGRTSQGRTLTTRTRRAVVRGRSQRRHAWRRRKASIAARGVLTTRWCLFPGCATEFCSRTVGPASGGWRPASAPLDVTVKSVGASLTGGCRARRSGSPRLMRAGVRLRALGGYGLYPCCLRVGPRGSGAIWSSSARTTKVSGVGGAGGCRTRWLGL